MSGFESELDVEKIRKIVAQKPRYKAIFELFVERQRGRQVSTPSRMRRVLRNTGKGDFSLTELSEFFQEMATAGAGRWMARRGKEQGFMWAFHLVSVAEAVLNKKSKTLPTKAPVAGEVRPAPTPRAKLPKVVLSTPEEYETPAKRKAMNKAESNVSEAAPSNKMMKINLPNGGFIEAPFGMSPEEREELAFVIDMAKKNSN